MSPFCPNFHVEELFILFFLSPARPRSGGSIHIARPHLGLILLPSLPFYSRIPDAEPSQAPNGVPSSLQNLFSLPLLNLSPPELTRASHSATPFIGRTENAATFTCICYNMKTTMRPYFPSHFAAASCFHSFHMRLLRRLSRNVKNVNVHRAWFITHASPRDLIMRIPHLSPALYTKVPR